MSSVLLTGGVGYIGSHTAVVLIEAGYEVVLYDNLSNSRLEVLESIEEITGKRSHFIEGDVRDRESLQQTFADHSIESVIHFAGLKAVGESVSMPLEYYDNNINGTLAPWHPGALCCDAGSGYQEDRLQLLGNRLWGSAYGTDPGAFSALGHQPLWSLQTLC